MPPLRFRLSTFLLVMALLCVAGGFLVQHREVLRLREALRQEELAAMVRDQRMQKTYGFFLAERGGQYHIPSGEYVFSQGVRAAGGEQWCRFRFAEGFDLEELVETMNLLTPRVFLVSTHDLVKQIEARADWFIPTAKVEKQKRSRP